MEPLHSRYFDVFGITILMENVYLEIADSAIQFTRDVNLRKSHCRLVSGRFSFNDLLSAIFLVSA